MDLSLLSIIELQNLDKEIKKEVIHREQEQVRKAREEILAVANSVGLSVKQIMAIRSTGALAAASKKVGLAEND